MSLDTLRPAPTAGPPGAASKRSGFRADIEGLRAVAVGLVVAFHAGVPAVTGGYVGVDVFFVLSGFLITGMLVDEFERTGTISISNFYARRIRRLLPLSALVVTATAVAASLTLPHLTQSDVAGDLRSASLYFANWHFAAGLTDYMAVGVDKSPVLHFWSLAVEEQFYVIWPMLILGLIWMGRRSRTHRGDSAVVRRVGLVIGLIFVVSLLWSVSSTAASGPWAYYGLHTRAWELAAGGGLAVARPLLPRIPLLLREVAAWAGVSAVVVSAFRFDVSTTFPGIAAAVPVFGTVLLVAAGAGSAQVSAARILSNRVFGYIGRISYAWYLWHWPCLILLNALPDSQPAPSRVRVVAVVVLSFVLSALSNRFVEDPARRSTWLAAPRRRSLVFGAVLTVASLSASLALQVSSTHAVKQELAAGGLTMSPAQARADKVTGVHGCHAGFTTTTAKPAAECLFGDPEGARSIALIGDSKAEQWFPGLDEAAKRNGIRLYVWTKDACPVNDSEIYLHTYDRSYPECAAWRTSMLKQLGTVGTVDHIIVGRTWKYLGLLMRGGERITDLPQVTAEWRSGARSAYSDLLEHSPDVVQLRDSPMAPQVIPTCLSAHPENPARCSFDRTKGAHLDQALYGAEKAAAATMPGIRFVDPTGLICGQGPRCPAVSKDGTIIYRDDNHMTQTFSRSLAPQLMRELELGR